MLPGQLHYYETARMLVLQGAGKRKQPRLAGALSCCCRIQSCTLWGTGFEGQQPALKALGHLLTPVCGWSLDVGLVSGIVALMCL